MSKQIDERVVQMQFDNREFESNVKTSMSTIEKLKQSLKFDKSAKSFEALDKAANKVDMSGMSKGIETVKAKFSAMEVVGVTALANITNSAVNAGKRMLNALTVAPRMDGFREYEMTLNAVQTTMSATGKTAKEVEKELKKLDDYADKTVYSTADMLQNLPKFTNAGVDLEVATKAMIGIANATAHAGGDASKASIAFYNLGQAIGTGYLTRMDYNSINNAGIATIKWKEAMVEAAISQGTLTKVGKDSYKAGKKTLTLQQLFIDGLQEQWATTDVMLKVFGDYGDTTTEIGEAAQSAAQDIKTFSMMMDSLKASAGTGWKDTWQLLFGGLDEAKVFWTSIYKVVSGVLDKISDTRNAILGGALGKTFTGLADGLKGVLSPAKKAADAVEGAVKAVEDLGEVVNQVIRGDFGNGKMRIDALTKAGYNFYKVQNKVNEKLGNTFRYSEDLAGSQEEQLEVQEKLNKSTGELLEDLVKMDDAQLESIGYTKEQIKSIRDLQKEADKLGYSVSEFVEKIDTLNGRSILINSFKNIGTSITGIFNAIKKAFTDVFDVPGIEQLSQGLYNLIAGFHKLTMKMQLNDGTADKITRTFKGLFAIVDLVMTVVGGPLKLAFKVFTELLQVFDLDILDVTAAIGDVLVKFAEWTNKVLDFSKVFEKIKPALESAFAAVRTWANNLKAEFAKVGANLWQGLQNGLSSGFSGIWKTLAGFAQKILDTIKKVLGIHSPSTETYAIGVNLVDGLLNGLGDGAGKLFKAIKQICTNIVGSFENFNWNKLAMGLSAVVAFFPQFTGLTKIAALSRYFNAVGVDATNGLVEGFKNGAKSIFDTIINIGKGIIDAIKGVLDINSPSKVFWTIGMFCATGLIGGIVAGIQDFDWSKISAIMWTASAFIPKLGILNIVAALANMFSTMGGNVMDGFGSGIADGAKGILGVIGSVFTSMIDFVKNLLGIHSPSKVFFTIAKFCIAGLVSGLLFANNDVKSAMSAIGGSLLEIAKTTFGKIAEFLGEIRLSTVFAVGGIIVAFTTFNKVLKVTDKLADGLAGFGKLASSCSAFVDNLNNSVFRLAKKKPTFVEVSKSILRIAGAMALLAGAVYLLAQIQDTGKLWHAVAAVGILAGVMTGMVVLISMYGDKLEGGIGKIALSMLAVAGTLYIMALALKKLEFINEDNYSMIMGALVTMISGLGIIMLIIGKTFTGELAQNLDKAAIIVAKLTGVVMLMAIAMKVLSTIRASEMLLAGAAMLEFGVIVAGLLWATKLMREKDIDQAGVVILKIAGAIGILAIATKLLGKMSIDDITKGGSAIAAFGVVVFGLMMATKLITPKLLGDLGVTLLGVAGSIAILVITSKMLARMEPGDMLKGIAGIALFGAVVAGLVWATRLAGGNNLKGVAVTLMSMALAVGILGIVATLMGLIDLQGLLKGVLAIGVLGSVVALMVHATKDSKDAKANMIGIAIAVGVMAASLLVLSLIDAKKLSNATVAMGTMLGIFTMAIYGAGQAKSAIGSIIAMTVAIGLITAAIYLLAKCTDTDAALKAAAGMTAVMAACSGMLLAMNVFGKLPWQQALMGLGGLVAILGVMYGACWLLKTIPPIDDGQIKTISVVTVLMGAMSVLLLALTGIGTLIGATGGVALLGLAGLGVLMCELILFADMLLDLPDLSSKESSINALSSFITTLSKVVAVLIGVNFANLFDIGNDNLSKFGKQIVEFANELNKMPDLATASVGITAISNMMPAMETIFKIMSKLNWNSFLSSLFGFNQADLGKFAWQITQFGYGLHNFNKSTKNINVSNIISAAKAGEKLVKITSDLPFDWNHNNLSKFGEQLSPFGKGIYDFGTLVRYVDPATTIAGAKAGKEIAKAASEMPQGWLKGKFIKSFGEQLSPFGKGIYDFGTLVRWIDPKTTIAGAKAGKEIAKAASELPSKLIDKNYLKNFSDQLGAFGYGLYNFGTCVQYIKPEHAVSAAKAAKDIALAAKEIPSDLGNNNLKNFGGQLAELGKGIFQFNNNVRYITAEKVDVAAKAAKSIAGAMKDVSDTKVNDTTIKNISARMGELGEAVNTFASSVDVNGADAENVKLAASAVESMAGAMAKILEITNETEAKAKRATNTASKSDWSLVDNFSSKLAALGEGIASFSAKVLGIDTDKTTAAATAGESIASAIVDMAKDSKEVKDLDLSNLGKLFGDFGTAIQSFASNLATDAGSIDTDNVTKTAESSKVVIEAIKELSKSFDDGAGNFTLPAIDENFKTLLINFGEGIQGFASALSKDFNADTVTKAVEAAGNIVPTVKDLANQFAEANTDPTVGTNIDAFIGENGLASKLGQGISDFGKKLGDVKPDTVSSAAQAGQEMIKMAKGLGEEVTEFLQSVDESGSNTFVTCMNNLGSGISEFVNGIGDVTTDKVTSAKDCLSAIAEVKIPDSANIASATASLKELIEMIKSLGLLDQATIDSFKNNMNSLGTAGIDKFIEAFKTPNETVTSAVTKFVDSVTSTLTSYQNEESSFRIAAVDLGKYLVAGFAKGIRDNMYLSNLAAEEMASSAVNRAKGKGGLDERSPSKKFIEVGKFAVLGLARGLTKYSKFSDEASRELGLSTLTAMQDELGIHSPSLVFDKKVGRWIVKGVAEGITKDMTAEEAAEQKAQNILNAFQKGIDRNDLYSSIEDNELEIWKATAGKFASVSEVAAKEVEYANKSLNRQLDNQQLAHDKWRQMSDTFGEASDYAKEAWNDYLTNQLEVAKIQNEIADLNVEAINRESDAMKENIELRAKIREDRIASGYGNSSYSKDDNDTLYDLKQDLKEYEQIEKDKKAILDGMNTNDADYNGTYDAWLTAKGDTRKTKQAIYEYESGIVSMTRQLEGFSKSIEAEDEIFNSWLNSEGKYATDEEIDKKRQASLKRKQYFVDAGKKVAEELHKAVVKAPGGLYSVAEQEERNYNAWQTANEWFNKSTDLTNEMIDSSEEFRESELTKHQEKRAYARDEFNLWLKTEGKYAEDSVIDSKELDTVNKELVSLKEEEADSANRLLKLEEKYGKDSEEYLDELKNNNNLNQQIADAVGEKEAILKRAVDREIEAADLNISNLDLQYQLWEKTVGRNATIAEKNVQKLSMLSQQLQSQSSVVQIARDDWQNAISDYGRYSDEAQSAYNKYLSEQLELANLQSEITDINEQTVEKQKAAKSDYKDYIKNYEKFYEMNGMTKAQLEEDAKLISGYDPSNTLTTMIDKTNDMFKSLTSSDTYQSMIQGFTSMGTSCVEAISAGINSQTTELNGVTNTLLNGAAKLLIAEQDQWMLMGHDLVQGLADGIRSMAWVAIEEARALAEAVTAASQGALGINSPSKVFAEIGGFAVEGLAKGLLDNASMAKTAAGVLSDEAVEGLKSTIQAIAEFVDSDIDSQPTIRPVLDLSDVQSGTARLNSMFSRTQAIKASASMYKDTAEINQNGENTPNSGNSYQFVQNNYSPKALSRTEIYRQTRNQFAAMKGVLG